MAEVLVQATHAEEDDHWRAADSDSNSDVAGDMDTNADTVDSYAAGGPSHRVQNLVFLIRKLYENCSKKTNIMYIL